jgi:nitrate/TMAO reductase-like tetraheme cytochrome c subunit
MSKHWSNKIADRLEGLMEHVTGIVLVAIAVVTVLGLLTGYRYYNYTQDEPQYCVSCHLMQEAFREWQRGQHSHVVCQQCHRLTILEQNKLLAAYVLKGNQPLAQTHGREKPWNACRDCHSYEMSQGSLTLEKSFGHARHALINKIQCKICHKISTHNFRPNESACGKCHKDKGVHLANTDSFSCLVCHPFSHKKKPAKPVNKSD